MYSKQRSHVVVLSYLVILAALCATATGSCSPLTNVHSFYTASSDSDSNNTTTACTEAEQCVDHVGTLLFDAPANIYLAVAPPKMYKTQLIRSVVQDIKQYIEENTSSLLALPLCTNWTAHSTTAHPRRAATCGMCIRHVQVSAVKVSFADISAFVGIEFTLTVQTVDDEVNDDDEDEEGEEAGSVVLSSTSTTTLGSNSASNASDVDGVPNTFFVTHQSSHKAFTITSRSRTESNSSSSMLAASSSDNSSVPNNNSSNSDSSNSSSNIAVSSSSSSSMCTWAVRAVDVLPCNVLAETADTVLYSLARQRRQVKPRRVSFFPGLRLLQANAIAMQCREQAVRATASTSRCIITNKATTTTTTTTITNGRSSVEETNVYSNAVIDEIMEHYTQAPANHGALLNTLLGTFCAVLCVLLIIGPGVMHLVRRRAIQKQEAADEQRLMANLKLYDEQQEAQDG